MLRIGILSAAKIAPPAIVEPAALRDDVVVTAIAARDRMRAQEFADAHGIANVVDSYDALCASDLVDAIYIATPPALHREWTIKALRAGKHVLCEKPLGANAADARAMVSAGLDAGLVMMEAFHWRYHPMAEIIRRVVADELGDLRRIEASFTVGHIPDDDIRFNLAVGGGALMDLGVYPVQWSRFAAFAGLGAAYREPEIISATVSSQRGPIDVEIAAELRFTDTLTARIHCSMVSGVPFAASLMVEGSNGRLQVNNPLAPQMGNDVIVATTAGERREQAPRSTTYSHQLDAFVRAVMGGVNPPTGGDDSIATMTIVDDVYRCAGMEPRPSAPPRRRSNDGATDLQA